jgi:hypothetical protein
MTNIKNRILTKTHNAKYHSLHRLKTGESGTEYLVLSSPEGIILAIMPQARFFPSYIPLSSHRRRLTMIMKKLIEIMPLG